MSGTEDERGDPLSEDLRGRPLESKTGVELVLCGGEGLLGTSGLGLRGEGELRGKGTAKWVSSRNGFVPAGGELSKPCSSSSEEQSF